MVMIVTDGGGGRDDDSDLRANTPSQRWDVIRLFAYFVYE